MTEKYVAFSLYLQKNGVEVQCLRPHVDERIDVQYARLQAEHPDEYATWKTLNRITTGEK